MARPKGIRRKHLSAEQVKAARTEYCLKLNASHLYLADKYGVSVGCMNDILANKTHHDPAYINPQKRSSGRKKLTYIPDHINDFKDELTPPTTTSHRARGHNYVINKFS